MLLNGPSISLQDDVGFLERPHQYSREMLPTLLNGPRTSLEELPPHQYSREMLPTLLNGPRTSLEELPMLSNGLLEGPADAIELAQNFISRYYPYSRMGPELPSKSYRYARMDPAFP
jgi:hypothetical protein